MSNQDRLILHLLGIVALAFCMGMVTVFLLMEVLG